MYYVYYVRFNGRCDISSNLSSLSVERNSRSVVTGFFFLLLLQWLYFFHAFLYYRETNAPFDPLLRATELKVFSKCCAVGVLAVLLVPLYLLS